MSNDIGKHLQNVHGALSKLATLDLAVSSITIEGPAPLIQVKPGRGVRDLKAAITKHINRSGVRTVEKVAFLCACQVRWIEPAAH